MAQESEVRAFYAHKNLFITGGTGFVGVCLIEKILRSIPDIGRIYLLMRPKKGKEISQRLEEIKKNLIFEKLLETSSPDIFNKLTAVAGDVGDENLGISDVDRRMLIENVHVVIHVAATLDFQESLKPTVNINLMGTRRIMELCKEINDLKAMIHVSSAYVNSYLTEAHERVYDAPADAEHIIAMASTLSEQALIECEAKIIGTHPNTYTFTKHLAEHEVKKCAQLFPCTIVRPTMIVAAWKEPVPGWTNSKVGPQGFLMGAAKGVVRRLPIDLDNIADYIPVDVVVNQLLVSGYNAHKTGRGLTVFHCSSSTCRPFTWAQIESRVNGYLHKYPLKSAIWYPHLKFVSSLWMFKLCAIFIHFIPAYILDMVLRLSGGRPILVRLHTNVWKSLNRLEKFIFSEWKFHNPNTMDLIASMNAADAQIFYIDITQLDWIAYFINLTVGVRRYLNNEPEKTLPAARKKQNILFVLHVLLQALIVFSGWYWTASILNSSLTSCIWAAPLTYLLFSLL